MRAPERVIYVEIGQRRQFFCKLRIVLLFFWMESQILQQKRLPGLQLVGHLLRLYADAVCCKAHVAIQIKLLVQEHSEPLGYWFETHLRNESALWTPQMGSNYQTSAV